MGFKNIVMEYLSSSGNRKLSDDALSTAHRKILMDLGHSDKEYKQTFNRSDVTGLVEGMAWQSGYQDGYSGAAKANRVPIQIPMRHRVKWRSEYEDGYEEGAAASSDW